MATTVHGSRALIATISQLRIRIRIPKLLCKIMHRRSSHQCTDSEHGRKKKKKWAVKLKKLLLRRIGRRIPSVFGNDPEPESRRECSMNKNNLGDCPILIRSPLPLFRPSNDILEVRDEKQRLDAAKSIFQTFNKKNGRIFIKERTFRSGFAHRVFGKRENLGNQAWAMVKRSTSFKRMNKQALKLEEGEDGAEEEDDGGLCNKRILLGKRCRPLDYHFL